MLALRSRIYKCLDNPPQLRSKETVKEIQLAVQDTRNVVFVIKGCSTLKNIVSIPDNVPID